MSQIQLPPTGPPLPPPSPPTWYPPGGPPLIVKTNGSALGALVTGILSFLLPGILSIVAIILGIVGKRSIDRSAGREKGRGMAVAGIALGTVTLVAASAFLGLVVLNEGGDLGTNEGAPTEQALPVHQVVGAACRGQGVPAAGGYRGAPPFHMVVLNGKGRPIDWTTRRAAWKGTTVGDTELVACITRSSRFLERCEYDQGHVLVRRTGIVKVRLVAARTGRVVDSFTLKADPDACGYMEFFSGQTDVEVGEVTFRRLNRELTEISQASVRR